MSEETGPTGFPRRIVSTVTLTRGGALKTATEWLHELGLHVGGLITAPRTRESSVKEAAAIALPAATTYPLEDERIWNVWVELHAVATSQSISSADVALRADFQRFQELLELALVAEQERCDDLRRSQEEFQELCYLLLNECGWAPNEAQSYVGVLHADTCQRCVAESER